MKGIHVPPKIYIRNAIFPSWVKPVTVFLLPVSDASVSLEHLRAQPRFDFVTGPVQSVLTRH